MKQKKSNVLFKALDLAFYCLAVLAGLAIVYSLTQTPVRILPLLSAWDKVFFIGVMLAVVKTLMDYFMAIIKNMKKAGLI